jgi:hypothetical protein
MYVPRPKINIHVTERQVRLTIPKIICNELQLKGDVVAEMFIEDWREKEEDAEEKVIVVRIIKDKVSE